MKSPHWEVGQKVHVSQSSIGRRSTVSTNGVVTKIHKNGVIVVEYIQEGRTEPVTAKFSGKWATESMAWETGKNSTYTLVIDKVTPELVERHNTEKRRKEAGQIRRQIINMLESRRTEWSLEVMTEFLAKLEDTQYPS